MKWSHLIPCKLVAWGMCQALDYLKMGVCDNIVSTLGCDSHHLQRESQGKRLQKGKSVLVLEPSSPPPLAPTLTRGGDCAKEVNLSPAELDD